MSVCYWLFKIESMDDYKGGEGCNKSWEGGEGTGLETILKCIKGQLNAKTNLFLFESISIVD